MTDADLPLSLLDHGRSHIETQELPSVSVGLKAVTKCQSQIRGLGGNWGSVPAPTPQCRDEQPQGNVAEGLRGSSARGPPQAQASPPAAPAGLLTELRLRELVAGAPSRNSARGEAPPGVRRV